MTSIYRYVEGKREIYLRLTQKKSLFFLCLNLIYRGRVMRVAKKDTHDINIQIPKRYKRAIQTLSCREHTLFFSPIEVDLSGACHACSLKRHTYLKFSCLKVQFQVGMSCLQVKKIHTILFLCFELSSKGLVMHVAKKNHI